jgi:hypothetical protein
MADFVVSVVDERIIVKPFGSELLDPFVAIAIEAAALAGHYANDDTDVDAPGGAPGERGGKYWNAQAAANLLLTNADVIETDNNVSESEGARDDAQAFAGQAAIYNAGANAALAMINAYVGQLGILKRFDTALAMNTAIGTIAANEAVMVWADETHGGRITFYQKTAGVMVLKADPFAQRKFVYLGYPASSDASSGLARNASKATWVGAQAILAEGDILCISNAAVLSGVNTGFHGVKYVTVVSDGPGPGPRIRMDVDIPQGSWIQDPTYADVEYADVTHQVITKAGGNTADSTHFCTFVRGVAVVDRLIEEPYLAGADIAANRAYVQANPTLNPMTVHRQGSTTKDPRSDTASTTYRYYRNKSVRSAMAGAVTVSYPECATFEGFSGGQSDFSGWKIQCPISIERSAAKDMCHTFGTWLEGVKFIDAAVHSTVGGALGGSHCFARTRRITSRIFSGGAFHAYRDTTGTGTSPGVYWSWSVAVGHGIGFYSHGNSGPVEHIQVSFRNIAAHDCTTAVSLGQTTNGIVIYSIEALRCRIFLSLSSNARVNGKSRWTSDTVGDQMAFQLTAAVTLDVADMDLVFRSSNPTFSRFATSSVAGAVLNLTGVTKAGACVNNTLTGNLTINILDSVMGDMSATPNWGGLSASNTQLSLGERTIAEIQAIYPGVNSNCLIPWVVQPYSYVAQTGDISYFDSGRTGSIASGANTITSVFVDSTTIQFGVGNAIQIRDTGGVTVLHTSYITAVSGTGAAQTITINDNAAGAYAGKMLFVGYFNKGLFPVDAGSVEFNDAGTHAYVRYGPGGVGAPLPHLFAAGQYIYIGGRGRRDAPGIRKITAAAPTGTGTDLTLDRPVSWKTTAASLLYATFATATPTGLLRPTYPIGFGFPVRALAGTTPTFLIDKPTLADVSGVLAGSSFSSFTNAIQRFASTGAVLASSAYGAIQVEDGVIDQAQRVMALDTYSVTLNIYVELFDALFEGDPINDGIVRLRRNSEAARLRLGNRFN